MSKINKGLKQIFSTIAKMPVHKMAEIEKEEVEFPLYYVVAGPLNIGSSALF